MILALNGCGGCFLQSILPYCSTFYSDLYNIMILVRNELLIIYSCFDDFD